MNEEHNPLLKSLFAEEQRELADECFTSTVMAGVSSRRRRMMAGRFSIVVLLVVLELLLESPLQNSLGAIAELLGTSLYGIDNEWLAFVLSPINSIAGLLGVLLLVLHSVYRRLMH